MPNPIAINFSLSLWKVDCHAFTLGVAQKISLTPDLYHATSFVQSRPQEDISQRDTLGKSHNTTVLTPTSTEHHFINGKIDKNPEQPILPKQAQLEPILPPPRPKEQSTYTNGPSDSPQAPQPLQHYSVSLEVTPQIDTKEPVLDCSNSHEAAPQMDTEELTQDNTYLRVSATEDQLVTKMSPVNPSDTNPSAINMFPPTKHSKEKNMPTRRSQRLQARQKAISSTSKSPGKAKSKMLKISFTDDSHLLPLDTNKTFEILQAIGLLITKRIEDLIDEVVQKDQVSDQTMPRTPLHDLIPPLTISDTDLFI